MFGLEQKLFGQLNRLKEEYDLQGIKAEFEAEGSSFRDLVRLRRITDKLNVPLPPHVFKLVTLTYFPISLIIF